MSCKYRCSVLLQSDAAVGRWYCSAPSMASWFRAFVRLCSMSVALFVYKIGYGFDPFIHQATERYLAEHGTITPKPFYYIGQYSWITFCNFFSHLGINLLDKILLPAMAATFLPAAIFTGMSQGFGTRNRFAKLGALLFLAIPFGSMIVTTPQGLANLFALIIIFLWNFIPRLFYLFSHPFFVYCLLGLV